MKNRAAFLAASAALLTACAGASQSAAHQAPPVAASRNAQLNQLKNGRSIYMYGRDVSGNPITAQPPPLRQRCAACHRADGSGGVHLPGGAVSADLRHTALVTEQKHPYTLALLERAISRGIDNEGKPLNPVMPRWKMGAADLHDVARYVLTRLK